MRVAFLTPLYFDDASYIGGGERYPVNLARGIVSASNGSASVRIVAYGFEPLSREIQAGVELRVLAVERRTPRMEDALTVRLPSAIEDCDVVHIHQVLTLAGEAGILSARLLGKPVCVTDHGGATSGAGRPLLDLADRVIAYSDFGASFLDTSTPISVVKGGVNGEFFTPPHDGTSRDIAVFVGRLMSHKGIDRLIAALPDGLPLIICGRPYHPDYARLLRGLSEGRPIEIVEDADDSTLRDLYQRAVAVILPSVYRDFYGTPFRAPELMGLALLEGMACAAPAICSRVAALPEFVDEGVNGFIFDTLDGLTARLSQLWHDPDLVRRLGSHARAAVDQRFDASRAGGRVLEIYEQLIGNTRG
jgi:glycosyltransferase involved in cell wall biosynthesis